MTYLQTAHEELLEAQVEFDKAKRTMNDVKIEFRSHCRSLLSAAAPFGKPSYHNPGYELEYAKLKAEADSLIWHLAPKMEAVALEGELDDLNERFAELSFRFKAETKPEPTKKKRARNGKL